MVESAIDPVTRTVEQLVATLGADPVRGLSSTEVALRQARGGQNVLRAAAVRSADPNGDIVLRPSTSARRISRLPQATLFQMLLQHPFELPSAYGKHLHLRVAIVFGGVGQNPQVSALQRRFALLSGGNRSFDGQELATIAVRVQQRGSAPTTGATVGRAEQPVGVRRLDRHGLASDDRGGGASAEALCALVGRTAS